MSDDQEPKEDLRAMWKAEERKKLRDQQIADAQATSPAYDGATSTEEETAKTDWEKLKVTAKLRFPDHLAMQYSLNPSKRLVAVAHCLGWENTKIATASGLSPSTIGRYLADDNTREFIKGFQYHNGTREAKEVIDSEVYASVKTLTDLRDDPSVSASTRADVAKFFIAMKYGKPTEKSEVKTTDLRALTESVQKSRTSVAPLPMATFDEDDEAVN